MKTHYHDQSFLQSCKINFSFKDNGQSRGIINFGLTVDLQIKFGYYIFLGISLNAFISLAPRAGIEPATCPLGGDRAIHCATGAYDKIRFSLAHIHGYNKRSY